MHCKLCNEEKLISKELGICLDCIRNKPDESIAYIKSVHKRAREEFGLTPEPPRDKGGIKCNICVNECIIGKNKIGFCGLRKNENGRLIFLAGDEKNGLLEYYFDPLPTNCVADFCCAANGIGYPKYSYRKGIEYGYKNLAVFYGACSFNCLFCQNWQFKYLTKKLKPKISAKDLARVATRKDVACICYFGGDPSPQIIHAIKTSEYALEMNKNRILRICFETNGTMNTNILKKVIDLSLKSGGTIKFDLKAFDEVLNIALTGVTNKQTLRNFEIVAEYFNERKEVPLLVASTLLVPGYIDEIEVEKIAKFISDLNPDIPYRLLAFHPEFYMYDLPTTSRKLAERCYKIAKKYLKNVTLGNVFLLS